MLFNISTLDGKFVSLGKFITSWTYRKSCWIGCFKSIHY